MAKTQRTVGEIVELARQLKELGAIRVKTEDIEFEFAAAEERKPVKFLTPDEYEEEAKKIRKKLEAELYEAS